MGQTYSTKLGKRPQYQPTLIKAWRKHRHLSGEQLAERLGISTTQLWRLENGKTPYTQGVLEAAAEALGCTATDLIARKPGEAQDTLQRLLERLDRMKSRDRVVTERLLKAVLGDEAA